MGPCRADDRRGGLLLLAAGGRAGQWCNPAGRRANVRGGGTAQATVRSTIDPNRAPWWEFTVLPRIGESLARRITEYRTEASNRTDGDARRPVFDSAASLDEVRGIGPKTVLRIAPYLRFD